MHHVILTKVVIIRLSTILVTIELCEGGEGQPGIIHSFVLTSTMCVLCIMGALCSASSFSTLFTYVPGTGVCNATSYFVPGTNYPHTLQRNI